MDCKIFLESVLNNTHHTIDSIAEMLDINPQELAVSENFSELAQQALLKLYHFLEEYSLISNGCLVH